MNAVFSKAITPSILRDMLSQRLPEDDRKRETNNSRDGKTVRSEEKRKALDHAGVTKYTMGERDMGEARD
jgi:hypothetical protein